MSQFEQINNLIRPGIGGNPWDVVEPDYFLEADWSEGVQVATGWSTSVLPNQKDGESRRARLASPSRRVNADLLSRDKDEASVLLAELQRRGFARTLFPLYSDQVNPDRVYDSGLGTGTISIQDDQNLAHYRFEAGQYIVIYNPKTKEFAFRQLLSVSLPSNTFGFNPFLQMNMDTDTIILPMIQARLELSSNSRAITDRVVASSSTGQELPGEWCLSPAATPGANPSGYNTYNDLPVLELGPDFGGDVQIRYSRTGRYTGIGNTQIAATYGDRMRQARDFQLLFSDRESWHKFLRLFDSRAGRAYSWWLPSFTDEYEITELTATGCKIKAFGPIEDWDFRPYISIQTKSGTTEIREIESVSTDDVTDTLIFTDGAFVETDLSNIIRAGFAQQVRFDSDELEENWLTSTVCEINVSTVEVIEEKTITLPNLSPVTTTGVSTAYEPQACDTTPTCEEACFDCANCRFSPGMKLELSIAEALADSTRNGLSTTLATYLEQNTPFDVPFDRVENEYALFKARISAGEDDYMDVTISYDCALGYWSWEYDVVNGGGAAQTFRACGDCLSGGSNGMEACSNVTGGSLNFWFLEDCWNSNRLAASDFNDWNIVEDGAHNQGCNGIAGWEDYTSSDFDTSQTGLDADKSAIMYGIRGEWTVTQDVPCCIEDPPCIRCLNYCYFELNCIDEPIESSTGCIAVALGMPAVDESGVVTCSDCEVIITINAGEDPTSCCRGGGQQCPRVTVSPLNGCLFDCLDGVDWLEEVCPRQGL